jgi:hypothetical protein
MMPASAAQLGLSALLRKVPSVKNCTLTHDGVLSANLWSSTAVHIYTVTEAIKVRQIKKLLQECSRLGIGSLFVVDARLLPPDGERTEPADWLLALHELSGDRIYTWRFEAGKLALGQVHFKPFGGNLREVWYGPDVVPAGLPFYRVSVKNPTLRGEWQVANFGNDLFWKRQGFRTERAAEYAEYEGKRVNGWSSERAYSAFADRTNPLLQQTKLEIAFQQLGLRVDASEADTKAAFRRLARECHPDVSRLPKEEAERRFRSITEAFAYIRQANGW